MDNNIKALLIDNDVLNRFSLGGVRINKVLVVVLCLQTEWTYRAFSDWLTIRGCCPVWNPTEECYVVLYETCGDRTN